MTRPTVICLTPVKNEDWILERFIKCASLWADYIIIADDKSTDGSREIMQSFQKVIIVDNSSQSYDEQHRQKLLIDSARKIDGPRLLITLDADEFLTSNFFESSEWQAVLNSKPGTVIKFKWANIKPDFNNYWESDLIFEWGFMDDGSEHKGHKIHSPRIPIPLNAPTLILKEIKVMHYQYTDWKRMESKHRWYQCWEHVNSPKRSAISIYRQYHHMYNIKNEDLKKIPQNWMEGYQKKGIDMTTVNSEKFYRWDEDILKYIQSYGNKFFAKYDIWNVNWVEIAQIKGIKNIDPFKDPRTSFQKMMFDYLKKTQPNANKIPVRIMDKIFYILGW